MEIEVKGHSGCQIDVVNEDGQIYVYKSTADSKYLKRLVLQGEKQKAAAAVEYQHIRVPKIYDIAKTDETVIIKMQYVYSKNFIEFFEQAGFEQVDYLIGALEYFVEHEISKCELQKVSPKIFQDKFAEIRSKVENNPLYLVGSNGSSSSNSSTPLNSSKNIEPLEQPKALNPEISNIIDRCQIIFDNLQEMTIPIGICHGDLTFSNILFNGNNYYLIDFLDSFIETPLQDIVKIRQDTQFRWSQLMYTKPYDDTRLRIVCDKIDHEIHQYFTRKYQWYSDNYPVMQLMNILRILPYAHEEKVITYLINVLNSILAGFETKTIKTPEGIASACASENPSELDSSPPQTSATVYNGSEMPSGKKQEKQISCGEHDTSCDSSEKNCFCDERAGFVPDAVANPKRGGDVNVGLTMGACSQSQTDIHSTMSDSEGNSSRVFSGFCQNHPTRSLIMPIAADKPEYKSRIPKVFLVAEDGIMHCIRALKSLDLTKFDHIYITILRHLDQQYALTERLLLQFRINGITNAEIVVLDEPTRSQPETIYQTILQKQIQGSIFIKDADCSFTGEDTADNAIAIHPLEQLDWVNPKNKSYVSVDDMYYITNIIEKRIVSHYFTAGGYSFDSADTYCQYYERLQQQQGLYLSHIIYAMLLEGHTFRPVLTKEYEDFETRFND